MALASAVGAWAGWENFIDCSEGKFITVSSSIHTLFPEKLSWQAAGVKFSMVALAVLAPLSFPGKLVWRRQQMLRRVRNWLQRQCKRRCCSRSWGRLTFLCDSLISCPNILVTKNGKILKAFSILFHFQQSWVDCVSSKQTVPLPRREPALLLCI